MCGPDGLPLGRPSAVAALLVGAAEKLDELLEVADSKYALVIYSAKRARQINSYFGQLGDGLGTIVPPQVNSVARKPLSIAFEEIADDKIVWTEAPVIAEVETEVDEAAATDETADD